MGPGGPRYGPGRAPSAGEQACLVLSSTADRPLDAAVFDLRPEGTAARVHPPPDRGAPAVIEGGREHPVFLRPYGPDGLDRVVTLLAVLAAPGPLDLDALEGEGDALFQPP